jgi:predicted GIY-YIG superfamily endonuclease
MIKKYYIGSSSDPYKRLFFHNSIEKGFTARYRPWKIVLIKKVDSKKIALQLETRIKKMKSQLFIEKLLINEYSLDYFLESLQCDNKKYV